MAVRHLTHLESQIEHSESEVRSVSPVALLRTRLGLRSFSHIISRSANILFRYGISAQTLGPVLIDFALFAGRHGISPSFPTTASVVKRHPALFRRMQTLGVNLSVHGYRHIDYTQITSQRAENHYSEAKQIFNHANIRTSGYRFPFLRRNRKRIDLLAKNGFSWDSSDVIVWPFHNSASLTEEAWQNYVNILQSYSALLIEDYPALPRQDYGLIEIPVSVPDDDILIERLRFTKSDIFSIWLQILEKSFYLGECFVIQLHPERFPYYKGVLEKLLEWSRDNGRVWHASLEDIAAWWDEKNKATVTLKQEEPDRWKVLPDCTDRTVLLINQSKKITDKSDFYKNWQRLPDHQPIHSDTKPIIGLAPNSSEALKIFLADEGFIFEITENPGQYSLYLKETHLFTEKDKRPLMKQLDNSGNTLIRFWRWPDPYISCFSVTGDIDGVDIWDYWSRFYGA